MTTAENPHRLLSNHLLQGPFGDAIPKREWDEFDPADLHDFERIRPQIDSLELFEDDKILSVEPIAISEEEIDLGKGNMRLLIYFKVGQRYSSRIYDLLECSHFSVNSIISNSNLNFNFKNDNQTERF